MAEATERRCLSCEVVKPMGEFYSNGRGRRSRCKDCRRAERKTAHPKMTLEDRYWRLAMAQMRYGKLLRSITPQTPYDPALWKRTHHAQMHMMECERDLQRYWEVDTWMG